MTIIKVILKKRILIASEYGMPGILSTDVITSRDKNKIANLVSTIDELYS